MSISVLSLPNCFEGLGLMVLESKREGDQESCQPDPQDLRFSDLLRHATVMNRRTKKGMRWDFWRWSGPSLCSTRVEFWILTRKERLQSPLGSHFQCFLISKAAKWDISSGLSKEKELSSVTDTILDPREETELPDTLWALDKSFLLYSLSFPGRQRCKVHPLKTENKGNQRWINLVSLHRELFAEALLAMQILNYWCPVT